MPTMSVVGTPQEIAATASQLQAIYDHAPYVVLSGSVGRAAIYASFDYADAPPLPLRADHQPLTSYRDLDLLFAPASIYGDMATAHLWYPHLIDVGLGRYIRRGEDGGCTLMAEVEEEVFEPIPADPLVIQPVAREFLGVSVLTLAVGAQLHVERLVPAELDPAKRQKRRAAQAAFALFADSVRASHPEEFLADELYEPFDRVAARRISYR